MSAITIAVFGSGTVAPRSPAYEEARQLGRAIADAGWTLCNGGYAGTMAASAQGAADAGGHVIGVTCTAIGRRSGPNPYIRQEVPTFDLLNRVNTLMRLADGYVVLAGGTGTLLELAAVWEFANKGFLRPRRPVVLLGDCWRPVEAAVRAQQPDAMELFVADEVSDVVPLLADALGAGAEPPSA